MLTHRPLVYSSRAAPYGMKNKGVKAMLTHRPLVYSSRAAPYKIKKV